MAVFLRLNVAPPRNRLERDAAGDVSWAVGVVERRESWLEMVGVLGIWALAASGSSEFSSIW